jgi:hypothetical protein
LGKENRRHQCGFPLGDRSGTRQFNVSYRHKNKKKKQSINMNQIHEMIKQDFTYQEVVQRLQVNPKIIKYYFKSEGLID